MIGWGTPKELLREFNELRRYKTFAYSPQNMKKKSGNFEDEKFFRFDGTYWLKPSAF